MTISWRSLAWRWAALAVDRRTWVCSAGLGTTLFLWQAAPLVAATGAGACLVLWLCFPCRGEMLCVFYNALAKVWELRASLPSTRWGAFSGPWAVAAFEFTAVRG